MCCLAVIVQYYAVHTGAMVNQWDNRYSLAISEYEGTTTIGSQCDVLQGNCAVFVDTIDQLRNNICAKLISNDPKHNELHLIKIVSD